MKVIAQSWNNIIEAQEQSNRINKSRRSKGFFSAAKVAL